jgi:hypothetical protein
MKKKLFQLLSFSSMLLFIVSCQKSIDKSFMNSEERSSANQSNANENGKKVYVANLNELYAAVNDADNAGTEVILTPGVYILNASYPNGGRLELQTDMSLSGQPGNPDAVLIDESALPASSFSIPLTLTAAVRVGRGTNKLEWLSLKGGLLSSAAFAVVGCDLVSTETSIVISHVKITSNGSRIGIDIRNRLPEHAGRKIYVDLQNSEISGFVNSLGFGITAFNLNDASKAFISLNMRGNYIHGNKIGLITNNAAAGTRNMFNSSVEIISHTDRLEGNGCAIDPSGGVSSSATGLANDNSTTIKMYGTNIRDNNPPGASELLPVNGALPCAIFPVGGYSSFNGIGGNNKTSNNLLKIELWGCDISNNNGTDIYAFAAWCNPAALLAGTNNLVEISLHGISANAIVNATASSPAEPAGTNVVNVVRN